RPVYAEPVNRRTAPVTPVTMLLQSPGFGYSCRPAEIAIRAPSARLACPVGSRRHRPGLSFACLPTNRSPIPMTDPSSKPPMRGLEAGTLMLGGLVLGALVGAGIGALVGAMGPALGAGLFLGIAGGVVAVIVRFRDV